MDFEVDSERVAKLFKVLNGGVIITDLPFRRTLLAALCRMLSPEPSIFHHEQ